ncbi:hypothetical protein [Collinsella aerofaciens]|uniref:hypothetical protein n=1 Tax=Collinsella aerofaciens TaxID=74426 RepID=UPI00319EAD8F
MANLVTFAKKLWKDATSGGTPITAAELNRMEGGINDCANQINKLGDSVSPMVLWGKSITVELKTNSHFALVLSANSDEQLTPFFVWRLGDGVSTTALPKNYSVTRDGSNITVSCTVGTTFVAYVYCMG